MASHPTEDTAVDPAFLADRELFWHHFTTFTKVSIGALVVLLLGMWVTLV